jgi:hypothetical protein
VRNEKMNGLENNFRANAKSGIVVQDSVPLLAPHPILEIIHALYIMNGSPPMALNLICQR